MVVVVVFGVVVRGGGGASEVVVADELGIQGDQVEDVVVVVVVVEDVGGGGDGVAAAQTGCPKASKMLKSRENCLGSRLKYSSIGVTDAQPFSISSGFGPRKSSGEGTGETGLHSSGEHTYVSAGVFTSKLQFSLVGTQ